MRGKDTYYVSKSNSTRVWEIKHGHVGELEGSNIINKAKLTVERGRNCLDKFTKTRDLTDDRLVSFGVHRAAI